MNKFQNAMVFLLGIIVMVLAIVAGLELGLIITGGGENSEMNKVYPTMLLGMVLIAVVYGFVFWRVLVKRNFQKAIDDLGAEEKHGR